jgi:hypothetical protein
MSSMIMRSVSVGVYALLKEHVFLSYLQLL